MYICICIYIHINIYMYTYTDTYKHLGSIKQLIDRGLNRIDFI